MKYWLKSATPVRYIKSTVLLKIVLSNFRPSSKTVERMDWSLCVWLLNYLFNFLLLSYPNMFFWKSFFRTFVHRPKQSNEWIGVFVFWLLNYLFNFLLLSNPNMFKQFELNLEALCVQ
jgi:hypothetical protein